MPISNPQSVPIWSPAMAVTEPSATGLENTTQPSFQTLAVKPHSVPVPWFKQKKKNWCWAACVQMVMHFFEETSVDQCEVASLLFNDNVCANPGDFDEGCDPEDIVEIFGNEELGVVCRLRNSTVNFERIQREIDERGRPVGVAVLWFTPDGEPRGGHVLLVKGWRMFDDRPFVEVNDPWYGRGDVSFSRLKNYYGPDDDGLDGVWKHTWTGFRRI